MEAGEGGAIRSLQVKEGQIDSCTTLDAPPQACLIWSCRWTFHPTVLMANELHIGRSICARNSMRGTTKQCGISREGATQAALQLETIELALQLLAIAKRLTKSRAECNTHRNALVCHLTAISSVSACRLPPASR